MKLLVTGADGLLGTNLVRELLDRGHQVRVMLEPGAQAKTLDGLDLERVTADLCGEQGPIDRAVAGADAVFHVAAITNQWAPPELTWKVNFDGTKKILDACLAAKVKRLVFIGSASSIKPGPLDNPGDETSPFPEEYRGIPYMESKHQAADLVRECVRDKGLNAVILMPTFMLGAYDSRPSSGEILRQFILRRPPVVPPGGKNFVPVRDAAKAVANALEMGSAGESYVIGGDNNISYLDFFERVAGIVGVKPPRTAVPAGAVMAAGAAAELFGKLTGKAVQLNRDIARASIIRTYYNPAKAERELGLAHTPLEDAIKDSLQSLRDYGHLSSGAFAGKVALVTGGSRGVGYATAKALLEGGAKVVITARTERRLLDSLGKLEALGEVAAVTGDVSKYQDAERMVNEAIEKFGRLDMVVNNAGATMRGHFRELAPEVCDQVTRTNFDGCVNVSRAAIEHLIAAKGQVVFISSIAGLFGLPGASIYCATKKALTGLAESMRIELTPLGVHVGVVYLGFTEHDPEKRIIAADGSLLPPDRPAHHTQAQAAQLIVTMLKKRKRALIMTPIGVLGAAAYRLSPALVERAILFAQTSQLKIFKQFS